VLTAEADAGTGGLGGLASATNTLRGGEGDDVLSASAEGMLGEVSTTNTLDGGAGNDMLSASARADAGTFGLGGM
jgi:Ca2+-binding RTX toxin-like protein